jgi:hypothetical protein
MAAPERGGKPRRARPPTQEVDAQALALREAGSSFSAIARRLELGRAIDAHRSFVRALGTHDGAEHRQLIENEEARLDKLEQRIRDRDAAEPLKIERRLLGLNKLRDAIRQ